jgi:CheY-like chemotaxis protein
VATIAVLEPHGEVRELILRIVDRLGHTPVGVDRSGGETAPADVVLLEPAAPGAVETARGLAEGGAALVCVSILPPSEAAVELEPVAYLQKPFSVADLERAIAAALAQSQRVRTA